MKKKQHVILVFFLIFVAFFWTACKTVPSKPEPSAVTPAGPGKSVTEWPTGVTKFIPEKCYNGFTIWCSLAGDGTVHFMDMRGKTVHSWKMPYPPGLYGRLLESGNLLYAGRTTTGYGKGKYHMSGKGGAVMEVDWNGKTVVKFYQHNAHHDTDKLPNGNYLLLLWDPVPKEKRKLVKGGLPGSEFPDGTIFEEIIAEVDPKGKIVWSWRGSDHLNPEEYPICPLDDRIEWLHANSVKYLPADNPITGTESIMVSLRQPFACIIFEKSTGKVQWRYGGCIEGEWGRLGAQHDFQMIQKGLPGEGNILVFDNGMNLANTKAANMYWGMAHSRILEIAPKTKRVVWRYEHKEKGWKFPIPPKWKFNSPYISGAQRLPNGNTLICEGGTGRIFEVTKKGEIVWEFINPDRKAVFRAYRYGPDFPGLTGKNLPKPY
ncbi:MAG: aryl-sulfate sulfotransferase [Deltaproteobacteria bacterium]|nr:aryl-sulfate sulfotransferase [Deltaproteobacteria bacterium]